MTRVPTITTVIYSVILCSGAWLGTVAPAQAGTVTDMFGVTMIGKRWCEGNPKFSENFTVKIDPKNLTTNTTLTIMRDVLNTGDLTDIQATITTHGESTDLDAIALNGLTFPRNTSHSIAELMLSGTNPSNPDHFFTIRGQATLDKLDNLTKVTGTFLFQETNTYTTDTKTGTQSGPVACFTSGTFRTNQKLSSSGGDFDNYFPFTQGNTWNFQGTVVETGQPTIHYQNVVAINGTRLIGGINATVRSESNSGGFGTSEDEYVTKDDTGITNYGNNDPTDPLTPQVIPYQELQFPPRVGASFQSVNKSDLDFGEDLDGDGKNETLNVTLQVTVVNVTTVTVSAGRFQHTAEIKAQLRFTVTLSVSGARVPGTETQTLWLAPGIGPIKQQDVFRLQGYTRTSSEELVSYVVNR